jgi:hypothetical protein
MEERVRTFHVLSSSARRAALATVPLGVFLVFWLGTGCGDEPPTPPRARAAAEAGAREAPATSEPALPAAGQFRVWILGGEVTLLANRAPRMQVLKELAREARFEVEVHAGGGPTGSVTLRAVDVPVERALARLLGSVPYALHYEADAKGEGARLARVAFGEPAAEGGIAGEFARSREPQPMEEDPRIALRDRERARPDREREPPDPARFEERQYEDIRNLEDSRAEVRVDAAESIYPDEEGVAALTGIVTDDPESAVRVAAAETLGQALEDPDALGALLRALTDPEPEVVITALDGISFVGDHTVIPEIQFLLEHSNSEVREATVDAIDWLEE